jgi:hypothetical protein
MQPDTLFSVSSHDLLLKGGVFELVICGVPRLDLRKPTNGRFKKQLQTSWCKNIPVFLNCRLIVFCKAGFFNVFVVPKHKISEYLMEDSN